MKNKIAIIAVLAITIATLSGCTKSDNADANDVMEYPVEAESQDEPEATESTEQVETSEQPEETEQTKTDTNDLYEFYGSKIEDVQAAYPDVKPDEGEADMYCDPKDSMEKESDGLALAGPFFYTDSDGKVSEIQYGGTKYNVLGISAGMSMKDAGDLLKEKGFEFVNVEVAHGTATYGVFYEKDGISVLLTSDEMGEFGETEESDVKGNVASIFISKAEQ